MLKDYIRSLTPVLDKENKYMFFCINKVIQTSINRNLLKDRAIVFKDDPHRWYDKFDSYSESEINDIYKFTIVRNPWDKTLSFFVYYKKISDEKVSEYTSFNDFVCNCLKSHGAAYDSHLEHQYPKSFYNDKMFVDMIGKFENIDNDWKIIADRIDAPSQLPHSNRTKHKHYSSYYTTESIDIVAKIYERDISLFNYKFEHAKTKLIDHSFVQRLLRRKLG